MLIGEVFEQLGELERAQELYELAIEQMPTDNHHRSEAYGRLAAVLEARGSKDEALSLLKRAVGGSARERRT
jgi:tetratricopeptide (TPR) repeat protein